MSETIGFIGLGVMGKPMAKNLIKAGHRLVVHSRSRGPVDEVVAAGATAAASAADVARAATVVITMLPDTADVELVLTSPDGVLAGLQRGALAGVSEALALAKKAGVDGARVRQALLGGFAASRVLEVHGERMLTGNYKPGFRTKLYQKDLRLANEAAAANGVAMPATAIVTQVVNALVAAGGADLDYAAIGTVLFGMAKV